MRVQLTRVICGGPGRLLVFSWLMTLVMYYAGPLEFISPIRPSTFVFIAASIGAFILGALAARVRLTLHPAPARVPLDATRVDRLTRQTALIGLLGILCITVDKLFLSGLDYSQGVTALRFQQIGEIVLTGDTQHQRSPLLYIGYLTFGFSVASYLLYLFEGERLSRRAILLAHLTLLSPVGFALLYGGRSPIALALTYAFAGIIARILRRRSALPRTPLSRPLFGAFWILFGVYTFAVFAERAKYRDFDSAQIVYEFDALTPSRPTPAALSLMEKGYVSPENMVGLIYTYFYLTHGLFILDRTLQYPGEIGPYYGQYNFYLAAALLAQVNPSLSARDAIRIEAQEADVYGWFNTALGATYLDFGRLGSLLFLLLCGWASGRVYRHAIRDGDLAAQLLLCYVIAGIIISPVMSPFTVSISLQVFSALIISVVLLRRAQRAQALRLVVAPGASASAGPLLHPA
jgi:oligosaccharide repeat unit polymerase